MTEQDYLDQQAYRLAAAAEPRPTCLGGCGRTFGPRTMLAWRKGYCAWCAIKRPPYAR